jgi:hypothetical protein
MEQVNGWTLTVFCGQVDDFILCRELGEPCWCCMYSAKERLPVSLLVNRWVPKIDSYMTQRKAAYEPTCEQMGTQN